MKTPTPELVARTWLRGLPFLSGVSVATVLPARASWADAFIQITSGPGEIIDAYMPAAEPVMQIDVWAQPRGTSAKAPWDRAATLAEDIRYAVYGTATTARLTIGGDFDTAELKSVLLRRAPRRVYGNPSGLARYSLDLAFTYLPTNLAIA